MKTRFVIVFEYTHRFRDRMGPERTGTPFLFFFGSPERRSGSFSRCRTLYLLHFNTRFLFYVLSLCTTRCTPATFRS